MRREDASARKYRIRRDDPPLDAEAQRDRGLPTRFLELVARSEALFEQICRLDQALYGAPIPGQAKNAVSDQIAQLQKAAETGAFDPLMVWHRAK
jgi:regulator of CtrA degradation